MSPAILGYVASALILLAMTMTAVVRLRTVGLLGSLAMAGYGALIDAWPVVAANVLIACAHVHHLRRLLLTKAEFQLQPIATASHWYFERFLAFYAGDIRRSHPSFDVQAIPRPKGYFILRDMVSAGLFLYLERGRDLEIVLDYVTPDYRDLKNAHFAYGELDKRIDASRFDRFVVRPGTRQMQGYFTRMGFRPSAEPGVFERPLSA